MPKTIEGWLIRYGELSHPIELPSGKSLYEVIMQNAFFESVEAIRAGRQTIEANIEHVDNAISRIGLTGKNVAVENRTEGVYATISLLGDSLSNDMFVKAKAGVVTGFSVEFDPDPVIATPIYSTTSTGMYVRGWNRLKLRGFALCTEPCYPTAQVVRVSAFSGKPATRSASVPKTGWTMEMPAELRRQIYEHESFLWGTRKTWSASNQ